MAGAPRRAYATCTPRAAPRVPWPTADRSHALSVPFSRLPTPRKPCSQAQASAAAATIADAAAITRAEKEEAEAKAWALKAKESERLANLAGETATSVCHTAESVQKAAAEEEGQAIAARWSADNATADAAARDTEAKGAEVQANNCQGDSCAGLKAAAVASRASHAQFAAVAKSKNDDAVKQQAESDKAKEESVKAAAACGSARLAAAEARGKADAEAHQCEYNSASASRP